MSEVTQEQKDFFYRHRNEKDVKFLAFYEKDGNYAFFYEKNNLPMYLSCDKNGGNAKTAQIPVLLADHMANASKLHIENKELDEENKKLREENAKLRDQLNK